MAPLCRVLNQNRQLQEEPVSPWPLTPSSASTATPAATRFASWRAAALRLPAATMVEKRAHFLAEYDWIRTGLMFEPRGHDMMSGAILYPPTRPDCDIAFLFIETSGCLPMCGHGTIGTVTMALERGLVTPREPGLLRIDTPAGLVEARYVQNGPYVESVRITNVAVLPARERPDGRGGGPGRTRRRRRLWRQLLRHRRAAEELPRAWSTSSRPTSCAGARACARRSATSTISCIPRTRPSTACPTCCGRGRRRSPRRMPATPCSMATRPSTVRPAAPAPPPAWRSGRRAGQLKVGDDFVHE